MENRVRRSRQAVTSLLGPQGIRVLYDYQEPLYKIG
jgi:hypothetical protein